MATSIQTDLICQPGDRLYEPIWQFVQLTSLVMTSTLSMSLNKFVPSFRNLTYSVLLDSIIELPVHNVINVSLAEQKPDSVQVTINVDGIMPPKAMGKNPGNANQHGSLQTLIASVIFVNFYELHSHFIDIRWRNNILSWPEVINFARVVRNAISHNGSLYFNGPNSPSAQWHELRYSPSMHGKKIIGHDLHHPELFLLLVELSEELDRSGAPIFG